MRKQYTGAINRFKTVVSDYQTTPQVEEALYRIVEANMTLGVVPEAQAAGAVLGHNFPNSQWYKRAHALLKSSGVQPGDRRAIPGSPRRSSADAGLQKQPAVEPKEPGPGPAAAGGHAGAQGRACPTASTPAGGRPWASPQVK